MTAPVADGPGAELARLIVVMDRLRRECRWDAEQTHRSLVPYLIEETYEVIEAIEADPAVGYPGDQGILDGAEFDHLREELGDLLLQVYFHSRIAEESGGFTVDDVAAGVSDKLIARHPHVFAGEDAPADLNETWERRKAVEKQRRSALEGIPEMSALSRAAKVISRSRAHRVGLDLPTDPITAEELGDEIIALVARAQASGVDAEQAARDALRVLEQSVRSTETHAAEARSNESHLARRTL